MDKIKLNSKARKEKGGLGQARKTGLIPAVLYGKKVDSEKLWVDYLEFDKLIKKSGESNILELVVNEKEKRNVIVQDIQLDPKSSRYIHIDFYQVKMDEKIETEVELSFTGESPAVKEAGGVLIKSLDSLEIRCFPADLPSEIKVDISGLKTFKDRISVKDLKIDPKVEVKIDPETVVATVEEPRSEEELEQLEEKVEEDVNKVEGVMKETPAADEKPEASAPGENNKEAKKE